MTQKGQKRHLAISIGNCRMAVWPSLVVQLYVFHYEIFDSSRVEVLEV